MDFVKWLKHKHKTYERYVNGLETGPELIGNLILLVSSSVVTCIGGLFILLSLVGIIGFWSFLLIPLVGALLIVFGRGGG